MQFRADGANVHEKESILRIHIEALRFVETYDALPEPAQPPQCRGRNHARMWENEVELVLDRLPCFILGYAERSRVLTRERKSAAIVVEEGRMYERISNTAG